MSIDFIEGLQRSVEAGTSTVEIVGNDYKITAPSKNDLLIMLKARISKSDMILFNDIIKNVSGSDAMRQEFAGQLRYKIESDIKLFRLAELCKRRAKGSCHGR